MVWAKAESKPATLRKIQNVKDGPPVQHVTKANRRFERTSAGRLRSSEAVVAAPFPRNPAGIFLPASIIGIGGYWLAGLWTAAVTHYFLVLLPVTLVAVFLGRVINHRIRGEAFLNYVYLGLVVIGALLLFQATTGRL
jgi:hypothetical protein